MNNIRAGINEINYTLVTNAAISTIEFSVWNTFHTFCKEPAFQEENVVERDHFMEELDVINQIH